MSEFTKKNEARKDGKARTSPQEYREARDLRRAVGGAFGNEPKTFWKSASVGTNGEYVEGGTGKNIVDD